MGAARVHRALVARRGAAAALETTGSRRGACPGPVRCARRPAPVCITGGAASGADPWPCALTRAVRGRRSTRRPSRSAATSSSSAPRTMPRPARRACGACSRTPRCPRRSSWPRRASRSTSDRRRRARRRAAPPQRPRPPQRAASAPACARAARPLTRRPRGMRAWRGAGRRLCLRSVRRLRARPGRRGAPAEAAGRPTACSDLC